MWRSRAHQLKREKLTTKQMHNDVIAGQKRKYESIIEKKDEKINEQKKIINDLEVELKKLREELMKTQEALKAAKEKKGKPLRYDDLFGDGLLSKNVEAFTFFNTADSERPVSESWKDDSLVITNTNDLMAEILYFARDIVSTFKVFDKKKP